MGAARYIHKPIRYDAFVSGVGHAIEAMLDERELGKVLSSGISAPISPGSAADRGDGTGV